MSNDIIRKDVTWGELALFRKILRIASGVGAACGVMVGSLYVFPRASRFSDAVHTHAYPFKSTIWYQTDAQATLYWWAWYVMLVSIGIAAICGFIESVLVDYSFKERKKAFWKRLSDEQNKNAQ